MSLATRPQRPTQNIDLFGLLDEDRDGRLTPAELDGAWQTLHRRDLDEDDTFTIEELQPLAAQQMQLARGIPPERGSDQPFLLLADDETRRAASALLLQRYSARDGASAAELAGVTAEALGVSTHELAAADADGEGHERDPGDRRDRRLGALCHGGAGGAASERRG